MCTPLTLHAALSEYEEPALEPERREELDRFVERRIREGGAPTDF